MAASHFVDTLCGVVCHATWIECGKCTRTSFIGNKVGFHNVVGCDVMMGESPSRCLTSRTTPFRSCMLILGHSCLLGMVLEPLERFAGLP